MSSAGSGASFSLSGSTKKTANFLENLLVGKQYVNLESLAQRGVEALKAATPTRTGLTGESWSYEIERTAGSVRISWINTHTVNGVNIAVILQYGHGTGTGGYVSGRDYINPAIKPVMDDIANQVWKQVTSS